MRWANYDLKFARPLHWILALYGGNVVPLKIEDIESGNTSCGHRFMSPEPFAVSGFDDYLDKAGQNYVIADQAQRKKLILEEAQKAAAEVGGKIFYTEDLLDTVSFIVEYPVIVRGSFDEDYLKIPKEVLTTTMIAHQKYFPVINDEGKLLPYFIAVSNTKARDLSVVARGNERVLRARLADASFFFEEDRKVPLEDPYRISQESCFPYTSGNIPSKSSALPQARCKNRPKSKTGREEKCGPGGAFSQSRSGVIDGGRVFRTTGHHGTRIRASGRRKRGCCGRDL